MNARGFRYYIPRLSFANVDNSESILTATGEGPSEALKIAKREREGYKLYPSFASPHAEQANPLREGQEYYGSLSASAKAAYRAALSGNPSQQAEARPAGGGPAYTYNASTSGCNQQAERELYGSIAVAQSVTQTPQSIRQELIIKTQSDPAVETKVRAWSQCVRSATGLSYPNPDAIPGDFQKRYQASGATAAIHRLEIHVAVSDAKCGFSTGLVHTYAATFRHLADTLPPNLQGELIALLEHERSAIARAKALLGSHG